MKRIAVLFGFLLLLLPQTARAEAVLPEIEGWSCGEQMTVSFETVSGNQGTWAERTYRTPDAVRIVVTYIKGGGASMRYLPADSALSADGPLGSGATYRTAKINGSHSVIEQHPLLGASLAVFRDAKNCITIETADATLDEGHFLRHAEKILSAVNIE